MFGLADRGNQNQGELGVGYVLTFIYFAYIFRYNGADPQSSRNTNAGGYLHKVYTKVNRGLEKKKK